MSDAMTDMRNNRALREIIERLEAQLVEANLKLSELLKDVESISQKHLGPWKLIATAPKDGTSVLLCSKKGKIANGYYAESAYWVWPYVVSEPAYWQPLPEVQDSIDGEQAWTYW